MFILNFLNTVGITAIVIPILTGMRIFYMAKETANAPARGPILFWRLRYLMILLAFPDLLTPMYIKARTDQLTIQ